MIETFFISIENMFSQSFHVFHFQNKTLIFLNKKTKTGTKEKMF